MELFFASAFILGLYIVLTIVNLWCIGVALVITLDAVVLQRYERYQIKRERELMKQQLKIIQGGKDDSL